MCRPVSRPFRAHQLRLAPEASGNAAPQASTVSSGPLPYQFASPAASTGYAPAAQAHERACVSLATGHHLNVHVIIPDNVDVRRSLSLLGLGLSIASLV